MPTQIEIAKHLGISDRRVREIMDSIESGLVDRGIDPKSATIDDIRIEYIDRLRKAAAGHVSTDGMDLTKERVLSERVDREIKVWTLAEKKKILVNREQLMPEMQSLFGSFHAAMLSLSMELKSILDVQYGIDIDPDIIDEPINDALSNLSRYKRSD